MDNKRDVFIEPTGMTGFVPLGKSQMAWTDFASGVASTKELRTRASGGNRANPSSRSIVAFDDVRTSLTTSGSDSTDVGANHDSDDHREGHGRDRR